MSLPRCFVALAAAAAALLPPGQSATIGADPQAAQEDLALRENVRVTLQRTEPGASLRIGDPVRWTIHVPNGARDGVALEKESAWGEDLALGASWSVLSGPDVTRRDDDLWVEWTLLPLEGGDVAAPPVSFVGDDGRSFSAPPTTIAVTASLGESEDEPRPLLGFREVPDRQIGRSGTVLIALVVLIALPLFVFVVWLARRSKPARPNAPAQLTPEEQLAALQPDDDPAALVARVGPLARRIVDARDGADRASLTDEEWGAALVESSNGSQEARTLARVVAESADVRFGGESPTVFAAREALDEVRACVDRLRSESGDAA